MKHLKVLGVGCPKCEKLTENAEAAARALGVPYDIEKVSDLKRIMSFNVMMTPALVVDGEVKVVGKVPSVNEIKAMLK